MALELVKCPNCGYKFKIDIKEREKDGEASVWRFSIYPSKQTPKTVKTIDIECPNPNCKKTFEYPMEQ